ncbi:MAG: DUF1080 domain-containing protein [Pirellulales bacterium]
MPRLFILAAFAISLLLSPAVCNAADVLAADADGWVELFNGRDLTGWTPKIKGHGAGENFADTFRVEDGILKVSYDKYDGDFRERFGHLFYEQPYSNYLLRLEYRLVGKQAPGGPEWARANSGVMIHGQTPESMALEQLFPVSIEVQLLAGQGNETRPTGNVCTPGTHIVLHNKLHTDHCTNSSSKTYPVGEWVAVELEVHGDKLIRHKINGQTVMEYSGPQLDTKDPDAQRLIAAGASKQVTGGTISLQSESHPVEFRNVKLKPLDK